MSRPVIPHADPEPENVLEVIRALDDVGAYIWLDRNGWLVFHNSKATRDAAEMITLVLDELGTPLVDGGNSSGDGQPAEPEVAHSSGPAG